MIFLSLDKILSLEAQLIRSLLEVLTYFLKSGQSIYSILKGLKKLKYFIVTKIA